MKVLPEKFKPGTTPMPRIVIAAPSSGSGKTTVTLAILAALARKKNRVQAYKCGPDYIDPGYHTAITGRISRNLDSWFVGPSAIKEIFIKNSSDAGISVIEGVMGLFDGKSPQSNKGSTAEISQILKTPVVLVLDARSMARSAAAIVKGFQIFDRATKISGIILNKTGGASHSEIIKEAIEKETGISVIGAIPRNADIAIPERHLGLLPSIERGEIDALFSRLADIAYSCIDMKALLTIAQSAPDIASAASGMTINSKKVKTKLPIAIAKDAAFNFYYPENIELLEEAGFEPVYFSPLNNEPVPASACALYIGGGFPEEFAARLSRNRIAMRSITAAVEKGMPALAECGGFMYLTGAIRTRSTSKMREHRMCGILPGKVEMQESRVALGYREISGTGTNDLLSPGKTIRGHEFHYSKYIPAESALPRAYQVTGRKVNEESGFVYKNLIAGYPHLYFLSCPQLVKNWYSKSVDYRKTLDG